MERRAGELLAEQKKQHGTFGRSKFSRPLKGTSKKKLEKLHKHMRALELRLEGKTLDEIKDALGYKSKGGAHEAVIRAAQRMEIEPVDTKRKLYLCKLNVLDSAIYAKACQGDLEAVKAWLKVLDGEMRLVPGPEAKVAMSRGDDKASSEIFDGQNPENGINFPLAI